jgi:porin
LQAHTAIMRYVRTGSNKAKKYLPILLLVGLPFAAWAQEDKKTDDDKPADPDTGESTIEEKTLGILPNPLAKYGVKFAATYIGEVLGNVSGGLKQGAIYEGRLNLAVDVDLQKLAGLNQLTFHANMFQIHGEGLSRNNLQNFFVVSGIEALPATRLYEAYFEKKWSNNVVSLKAGQLAADSEFFNTKYTDVLTNASMGWPAITSVDLPKRRAVASAGGSRSAAVSECKRQSFRPWRGLRRQSGRTRDR